MTDLSIFIIHGPTASGKSAAALRMAQTLKGEIVNGDSMQLYSHLSVLTARPTYADCNLIPHHLYGVLHNDDTGSVGWWYEKTCETIQDIVHRGSTPIIVGGTGLYLQTLSKGLTQIPDIPNDIRQHVRALDQKEDLYDYVCRVDPSIKTHLRPSDKQRLMRALEVFLATNRSIRSWQEDRLKILDLKITNFGIIPDRSVLYKRINNRCLQMVENGAIDEVKNLMNQNIRPDSPILKAVGVSEFKGYLCGTISLEEAIEKTQKTTRNYAKRQLTWLRHQVCFDHIID